MKSVAYHRGREGFVEGDSSSGFRLRIFEGHLCIYDRRHADPFEVLRFAELEFGFPMFEWGEGFDHPDVPGWQFSAREQSAGVWKIEAHDADGRSVSRVGINYDELLRECVEDARTMAARYNSN
jgi:hypothetical protein